MFGLALTYVNSYSKFKLRSFTHSEDRKGDAKVTKWIISGSQGSLKVIMRNSPIRQIAYDFLLVFHYCLYYF